MPRTKNSTSTENDFYKTVLENLVDYAVFTVDLKGNITSWNRGIKRMLGYYEKDVIGKNLSLLMADKEDADAKIKQELNEAKKTGRSMCERAQRRKDGTIFWAGGIIYPLHDADGKHIGYSKIIRDLTKQKQIEIDRENVRKQAENFGQKLNLALQAGRIGTFEWFIDENRTVWTKELEELYGLEVGTFKGTHEDWLAFLHPDDVAHVTSGIKEALGGGSSYNEEFRVILPDGRIRWMAGMGDLYYDKSTNRPIRMVGINADITVRKQVEENLMYRTALLEAQNEATPDGTLIVDAKGKILSYNKRFAKMWKIPRSIMNARDDNAALEYGMKQLTNPKEFIDRVNYLYTHPNEVSHEEVTFKDGRVFERFGMPVNGSDGTYYGWAWHFRDITFRKRREDELKESEQRFHYLADNTPVLIWQTDDKKRCTYVNKTWREFRGRTLKQDQGFGWVEGIYDEDKENSMKLFNEAFDDHLPFSMEYRMRRSDGMYRWILVNGVPRFSPSKKFLGYVGSGVDIHELKRKREIEKRAAILQKERRELVALNKAKDEFVSLSSHQLRTPATGVKQYIGMLLEGYGGRLTKHQKKLLHVAYESNDRQLTIIDDLLKVAQVDAGKVSLSKSSTNLVSLLKSVVDEQQEAFKARKQKIILTFPGKPVKANVDAYLLRMVLENIIDNGGKYSYEDSSVLVNLCIRDRPGCWD